jgi:hypothetical protein
VAWRTVVAAVLVPLGLLAGGIPSSLAGIGGRHLQADEIVLWAELAVFAAAAIVAVTRAIKSGAASDREKDGYLYLHAALYLGAFALLWGAALPAYADARQGITAQGAPIGSFPYAAGCALVCVALIYLTLRAGIGGLLTGRPLFRFLRRRQEPAGQLTGVIVPFGQASSSVPSGWPGWWAAPAARDVRTMACRLSMCRPSRALPCDVARSHVRGVLPT